jgi:hypothetical protein
MTLIELPGNQGQVFAVDPAHVTALAPYRSTLAGRGAQLFDMTIVWIDNRTLFVCSWSIEHTSSVLNTARSNMPLYLAFEAGYREGGGTASLTDIADAFRTWKGLPT